MTEQLRIRFSISSITFNLLFIASMVSGQTGESGSEFISVSDFETVTLIYALTTLTVTFTISDQECFSRSME